MPFGETFVEEKSSGSFNNPYKFSGQELDKNTGFYLFGARYYNPKTSLWLSLDPLAELFPSVGGYVYSYNNPVMFSDPTGLEPDPKGDADCPTCKTKKTENVHGTLENPVELQTHVFRKKAKSLSETLKKGLVNIGRDFKDFVLGAGSQYLDGIVLNQSNFNKLAQNFADNPKAFNQGVNAANAGLMVQGVAEVGTGAGEVGVGIVAAPETAGASLIITKKGVVLIMHGAAVTKTALNNIASGRGQMKMEDGAGIDKPYKRPNNATTKSQRESVQGKECVDCGTKGNKMVADHKKPLVKEYYETGKIDKTKMKDVKSVQPQCPTCSSKQGGKMSNYSKEQKKKHGL